MDIELRNQLGALTVQVQELTKQSKTLDGSLSSALDKGSKSAGGLVDSTRRARQEMGLVDTVSQKLGSAWTRQLLSFAVGATSVTAIWQTVSNAMSQANQRLITSGKSTADYTAGTRLPGDNPAMRRALRDGAQLLTPEEQQGALKAYRKSGGRGDSADLKRLGTFLDQSLTLGLDTTASAATYAQIGKAGVTNQEDTIAQAYTEGRDLSTMRPGALRAYARQKTTSGSLDRLKASTRIEEVDRLELTLRAIRAKRENGESTSIAGLKKAIADELDAAYMSGTPGFAAPLIAGQIAQAKESAQDMPGLRKEARSHLERQAMFKFLVTDKAVEHLALQYKQARQDLPDVAPGLADIQRSADRDGQLAPTPAMTTTNVRIIGDDRPVPVNVGE